jgi:hypothetical protein
MYDENHSFFVAWDELAESNNKFLPLTAFLCPYSLYL